MMLDAEKWVKAKGFNKIYLSCLDEHEGFYKKCGYSESKEEDYEGWLKKDI